MTLHEYEMREIKIIKHKLNIIYLFLLRFWKPL
jgi:hypothetical protein